MAANLTDVARLAGVSPTLVSGYINRRKEVRMSESTRLRIENALRELDYHPNRFARKLRTGKSHLIGVCGLAGNEVGTAERRFLTNSLEKKGYRMMQGSSSGDEKLLREEVLDLLSHGCDGLILRLSPMSEEFAGFVNSLECPVVCITHPDFPEIIKNKTVSYDNAAGIHAAMTYLHNLGHEHVLLAAKYWSAFSSGPRAAAFRTYPNFSEDRIKCFNSLDDITPERVLEIKKALPQCTAWICLNDMTALKVIQCCKEAGIQIPQDLSIIGSDDCEAAKVATPALTSIHQPCEEVCKAALNLLFNQLYGKNEPCRPIIPATLTVRKSCTTPCKTT
jgi:LacI family repressor for deo operon, udp, cdd, tsx, nupC, and nupG